MFYLKHSENNLFIGHFSIFPDDSAIHAISTRFGGVSKAPYDTLNLALHVGDDIHDVIENRRLFSEAIGIDCNNIVTPEQVHSDAIYKVTKKDMGRGSKSYDDAVAETDALMTDERMIPIMLCYADCTPIILLDPIRHAAAIAHGGWKGTLKSIAAKTVAAMRESYGSNPKDILAGIGPAIGPCCYDVNDEVADLFSDSFPEIADKVIKRKNNKIKIDLWELNRWQLEKAGLRKKHIDMANICTYDNSDVFYSYRKDSGRTGRIAALIAIK